MKKMIGIFALAALFSLNEAISQTNISDSLKGNFLPYTWINPYHYSLDHQFNTDLNRYSITNRKFEGKSVFEKRDPPKKWGYNPNFSYEGNLPGTIIMTVANRFANREERKLKKILKEESEGKASN